MNWRPRRTSRRRPAGGAPGHRPTAAAPAGGDRPRVPFAATCARQCALLDRGTQAPDRFRQGDAAEGTIHADLFRDNVLFDGDRVAGSSTSASPRPTPGLRPRDHRNDWCVDDADGGFALGASSTDRRLPAVRPPGPEREQWPSLLRAAALRFWLSRLYDLHLPRPGELVTRTIPPTSSASCATACCTRRGSPRAARIRDDPVTDATRYIAFTPTAPAAARLAARSVRDAVPAPRGVDDDAAALLLIVAGLSTGPLPRPVSSVPLLKPVFAVGFLAAAWTQERGGSPT